MFIKVYFDDKPLFLCDNVDATLQPYIHHDDAVFIDELNLHTVKSMIHEMQKPSVHAGVFFNKNLKELKDAFFKKFTLIKAAGGFVLNENNEALMMFRRGKWDLPKGKMDKKETFEECAIRETEEETGLKNIKLLSPLITTYHTYHEGSKYVLKETKWFMMKISGQQKLIPQATEQITKLEWVERNALKKYLQNSFPSVNDVLEAGFSS
ncbi:MAG TPA: NUDIX domain-containing protein [Chitinophagaceae bacterium]|nr:NUDIX domain-containing protein [Chitinophagaceae bacterium]